ncbi:MULTISPECIES: C40 family peptidase [unclassified Serratia (in: enterobacteria)]|uniref:C40 family peptidase n=1 Tax=unclassified Serratia (in: enterobacteria) TaxID=2647522 RepID=UPI0005085AB4|nr:MULTISPECIES: C40 family peptidase [unclassified Serratia (in: enterobacteria)]KFK95329.1 hypothetical protein JV45_08180 [Serratia sp. Ag2]KFK98677.1 hypothetical protein IV04_10885 [Serratia sp. Ag1]
MTGFFILPLLLLISLGASAAPAKKKTAEKPGSNATQPQNKEALERMQNRAKLLAKSKGRLAVVPLTPEQARREALVKQEQRLQNREQLAMHGRWKPGYIGGSDRMPTLATEELMGDLGNPRVEVAIHTVIQKLKSQIGIPYVWGGQTPSQGFDCSGLVYYVYNQHLNEKLPRTTNQMYQSKKLRHIKQGELRKGDLVFFRIKKDVPDHVGVYLGDGQFIESPRTGANVRISKLTDNFWQSHYIGAKRVITETALL